MGRTKRYWRELAPIVARTPPAFSQPGRSGDEPARDAEPDPDDDLKAEILGLRADIQSLASEIGRQQAVLDRLAANAGAAAPQR